MAGIGFPAAARAQIIPDGATSTAVRTASSGQSTVAIAPAASSGISRNTYSSFSVGPPGANLDNSTANATTIVNEVTSARRSFLGGPIAVLGQSAHVIIANPNGITVDGASFANTGGVVLSGGTVSYAASPTSPGILNAAVGSGADIVVTGQGLAGAMPSLQLIAQKIRIDGPVSNTNASPKADLALYGGNTALALDSTVTPGTTLRPWASAKRLAGGSEETLVDVTPNGSLSASHIHIAVNAKGAGVAFAGAGQAGIGGFDIAADGKVSLVGARIQAEKTVKVIARSIDVLNAPARQSSLASLSGGVTLLASDGDLTLHGQLSGAKFDPDDADSQGTVTLGASGDIRLLSESAERLAIAFASDGDLVVKAGGAIDNDTGRLLSNGNTVITAGGAVTNRVDTVATVNGGQPVIHVVHGPQFFFGLFGGHSSRRTVTYDLGALRIPNQLGYIVGSSVFVTAAAVDNTGEIDASEGALKIDAGTIANTGVVTGSMATREHCNILFCTLSGSSDFTVSGGKIQSSGSMAVNAAISIANDGGQIVAYGNLALAAPSITAAAAFVPEVVVQPGGLSKLFRGDRGWIVEQPVGGQFIAPVGSITIDADAPVTLDGGELLAQTGAINAAGVVVLAPASSRFVIKPHPISLAHQVLK